MIRRRQVVGVRQINPHKFDGDLVLLEGLFDHGLEANGIVADGLRVLSSPCRRHPASSRLTRASMLPGTRRGSRNRLPREAAGPSPWKAWPPACSETPASRRPWVPASCRPSVPARSLIPVLCRPSIPALRRPSIPGFASAFDSGFASAFGSGFASAFGSGFASAFGSGFASAFGSADVFAEAESAWASRTASFPTIATRLSAGRSDRDCFGLGATGIVLRRFGRLRRLARLGRFGRFRNCPCRLGRLGRLGATGITSAGLADSAGLGTAGIASAGFADLSTGGSEGLPSGPIKFFSAGSMPAGVGRFLGFLLLGLGGSRTRWARPPIPSSPTCCLCYQRASSARPRLHRGRCSRYR